jgi:hypothetical protein
MPEMTAAVIKRCFEPQPQSDAFENGRAFDRLLRPARVRF